MPCYAPAGCSASCQALKVLALLHFVDLSLGLVPVGVKYDFKSTKPNEEEEEGALPQAFPSGQRPRALYIGRRC